MNLKSNFSILIVDDLEINISMISELIKTSFNVNIFTAIDGSKALEIALSESINLILLDIQMPIMGGFEVVNLLKMKNDTRDIPIIFVSANNIDEESIKEGYKVGAVDFISKPVDDFILLKKIENYIKIFELEESLKEKERYIRAAFDAQQNMCVITLGGKELEYCNKAVLNFFGFENIEKLKEKVKCICDYFAKEDGYIQKEMGGQNWLEYLLGNKNEKEYAKIIKDGKEFIFSLQAEEYGTIPAKRAIVSLYDVTLEKKYEHELLQELDRREGEIDSLNMLKMEHERNLLNQHRLKSMHELVVNISHHWRQPLNHIATGVSLIQTYLEDDGVNGEKYDNLTSKIQQSLKFLSDTITSFQSLTKNGKENVLILKNTINEYVLLIRDKLREDGIEIEVIDDNAEVTIDKGLLVDVIQSIVNNSKEALILAKQNNQNLECKIEIEIKNLKYAIHIHIRDNGIGIAEEIRDSIFDPYFTTKFKSKGVGLSLYMAKMVVEDSFGGDIYLNESVEDGAEFVIEIPIDAK